MTCTLPFSLQPFLADLPQPEFWRGLDLTGTVIQQGHILTVQYALRGNLDALDIPIQTQAPKRTDGLWEGTCFEFFLGQQDSDPYWEFNLAPTGDWNVYRFDLYRQGMTPETAFTALPFQIKTQSDGFDLTISLSLADILPAATLDPTRIAGAKTPAKLEMAISTVLKAKSQALIYWALIHPGPDADFHRRDSFVL